MAQFFFHLDKYYFKKCVIVRYFFSARSEAKTRKIAFSFENQNNS